MGVLRRLASPWVTVAVFLVAAASALLVYSGRTDSAVVFLVPFLGLVLNLGSALVVNPRFRSDLPLLVLHLALLAMAMLFVLGRLTYFNASFSVIRGAAFDGRVTQVSEGAWHQPAFRNLVLFSDSISEHFTDPDRSHLELRARLSWRDGDTWGSGEIEFGEPLLLGGYRIYLSGLRGFALVFSWIPEVGDATVGTVELFGPYEGGMENSKEWTLPNGQTIWAMLEPKVDRKPTAGLVRENLGVQGLTHQLLLRIGDERKTMNLGDTLKLPGGALRYQHLEPWTGFYIARDPTVPWLVATVLVAIGALMALYVRRFAGQPPEGAV